jgi:hypothetical protein
VRYGIHRAVPVVTSSADHGAHPISYYATVSAVGVTPAACTATGGSDSADCARDATVSQTALVNSHHLVILP